MAFDSLVPLRRFVVGPTDGPILLGMALLFGAFGSVVASQPLLLVSAVSGTPGALLGLGLLAGILGSVLVGTALVTPRPHLPNTHQSRVDDEGPFASLFASTHPAGLLTPDGRVLEANETALRLGGLSWKEVNGTPIWEAGWFRDEEASRRAVKALVERASEGEFVRDRLTTYGPDGAARVDVCVHPVRGRGGRITMLLIQGQYPTERLEEEDPSQGVPDDAPDMASRLTSTFLTNLSHEVRTPLTAIIGYADTIKAEAHAQGDEEGPFSHFADRIQQGGYRLLHTIDALIDFSKLEADQMELPPERVDLAAAVAESIRDFRAHEAPVKLRFDLAEEGPVWIRANKDGIRILLRYLLSNAAKFSQQGEAVTVRVSETASRAMIEVKDTGMGMDPTQVPRLFGAFMQGSTGVDRSHQGNGLGLAVANRLVDRIGGRMQIYTSPGEGTSVIVSIPREDPTAEVVEPTA